MAIESIIEQYGKVFGRRRLPEIASTPNPNFKVGLITAIGARAIARGGTPDALNWMDMGDRIELRRGQAFLGTNSVNQGNGKASGIKKVVDSTGVEHLLGTYGQSLKYFDIPTQEWIENGTNLLGPKVVNSVTGIASEDIFMSDYVSPAGVQVWLNSPNCAGFFKIYVANLGSASNQYKVGTNYKGYIKIDISRTLLWGLTTNQTDLFGSYIDRQTYTTVTGEKTSYMGNSFQTVFTGYELAAIATNSTTTVFNITTTVNSETFTDNGNGLLVGSGGSTGTINYVTGAITFTFITAPAPGTIQVSYQSEDSTNNGIADFTKSAVRTAGQGFVFPQGSGGGALENVSGYNGTYYCLHLKKAWALTIGVDDTTATNLPYRELVGVPNPRAAVEAGEGIYYIDDRDPTNIKVRLLTYGIGNNQQVLPVPVSNSLILNNYNFDQAASILWGDFVLFSCRRIQSTINDRILVYNKLWKTWCILDYNATCFEVYNGTLVCGDAVTNNFITLFSGWDDLGSTIDNYWTGNLDNLGSDGLKKTKFLYLEGDIAPDQSYDVYLAADDGAFVKVGSINGRGDYVDKGQSVAIGGTILGEKLIGGNISQPLAYHYEFLMRVNTDKFEYSQIKFQATGIGYVSVRNYRHWDWRFKGKKVPKRYRNEAMYPYPLPQGSSPDPTTPPVPKYGPSYFRKPINDEILNTQGLGPVFTLANPAVTGSLSLFRGGSEITVGNGDYMVVYGAVVTTVTLTTPLSAGETLTTDYLTTT